MTKAKAQNEGSDITPVDRGPGRPTTYTPEVAAEIIRRLSEGEPLAVICRDEHMPAVRTVSDWKAAHPDFSAEFAQARDLGHDAIAVRIRATARGKVAEEGGDSTGDVQRDKLIIDTDLKLLSKWDPRRYGDKHIHVGGGPDDAPIRHEVDLTGLSDEELEQLERIRSKIGAALTGGDQGGEGSTQA